MVKEDGKWRYFDKTGKLVVPCQYELLNYAKGEINSMFHNEYAAVLKDGKVGFIDKEGKLVVEHKYEWVVSGYKDGLFAFKEGFVDVNGKEFFQD